VAVRAVSSRRAVVFIGKLQDSGEVCGESMEQGY